MVWQECCAKVKQMKTTIYHNPKCSKSRQSLELLRSKGEKLEVVEYLKTPPSADVLKGIVGKLGVRAGELVRKKEGLFKELALNLENDDEVINALVRNPVLIQRPIVVRGEKAVLGRPPENIEKLYQ
jgi:arsenate reductase (glutaredoxin)